MSKPRNATTCLIPTLALSASSSTIIVGDLLRAGMCEVMSTMAMANMAKGKPARRTHCYSAEDVMAINARDATAIGKTFGQTDKRCSVSESRFDKNRSVWLTKCPEGTTRYELTYGGDTFESAITTNSSEGRLMGLHQKATRIGECK